MVPCYNESAAIPELVMRLSKVAEEPGVEVIFVDNGSTDNSRILLSKHIAKYPSFRVVVVKENQGYGYGLLRGLEAARGEILGWTHADLQADPQDALVGLEKFESQDIEVFTKGQRFGRPAFDVFLQRE